jgi:hypothetical protein
VTSPSRASLATASDEERTDSWSALPSGHACESCDSPAVSTARPQPCGFWAFREPQRRSCDRHRTAPIPNRLNGLATTWSCDQSLAARRPSAAIAYPFGHTTLAGAPDYLAATGPTCDPESTTFRSHPLRNDLASLPTRGISDRPRRLLRTVAIRGPSTPWPCDQTVLPEIRHPILRPAAVSGESAKPCDQSGSGASPATTLQSRRTPTWAPRIRESPEHQKPCGSWYDDVLRRRRLGLHHALRHDGRIGKELLHSQPGKLALMPTGLRRSPGSAPYLGTVTESCDRARNPGPERLPRTLRSAHAQPIPEGEPDANLASTNTSIRCQSEMQTAEGLA